MNWEGRNPNSRQNSRQQLEHAKLYSDQFLGCKERTFGLTAVDSHQREPQFLHSQYTVFYLRYLTTVDGWMKEHLKTREKSDEKRDDAM